MAISKEKKLGSLPNLLEALSNRSTTHAPYGRCEALPNHERQKIYPLGMAVEKRQECQDEAGLLSKSDIVGERIFAGSFSRETGYSVFVFSDDVRHTILKILEL